MFRDRYDQGTRIWTTVLGATVAAVIDWIAVVNPARGIQPHEPYVGWWILALIMVSVSPAAWFVGRLAARDYSHALVWLIVLVTLIIAHYIPLSWAFDKT